MKKLFTLMALFAASVTGAMAQHSATVTWSMADGSASVAVADPTEDFLSTNWTMGSNIVVDATETGVYFAGENGNEEGTTFTRFTNLTKLDNNWSKIEGKNYIDFKFTPYPGLTFQATKVSFDITKIGTGDPKIWVRFIDDESEKVIGDGIVIRKSSETEPSEYQEFDLSETVVPSQKEMTLRIYIGKLATNKQVGIANVKIEGSVTGSASTANIFDVAVAANPEEGGSVTVSADKVEEGSEVTIIAKANRGYEFVNWTNADNEEVSDAEEYTFTPEADVNYTANFEMMDVRSINITADQNEGAVIITAYDENDMAFDAEGIYLDGDKLVVEARPANGYMFKEWSDGSKDWKITKIVSGDITLSAVFEQIPAEFGYAAWPAPGLGAAESSDNIKRSISVGENLEQQEDAKVVNGISLTQYLANTHTESKVNKETGDEEEVEVGANGDETYTLKFGVNPKNALAEGDVFVVRTIEFDACRFGTDGGDITVRVIRDGVASVVASGLKPNRDTSVSHYYFNVADNRESAATTYVELNIGGSLKNKAYGLANIRVQGYFRSNQKQEIVLGSEGWATYVAPCNLDFSENSDLKVSTATFDEEANTVTLTQVQNIQAGTVVVLNGPAKTYAVNNYKVTSSTAKGDLKGSADQPFTFEAGGKYNYYGLNVANKKAQFTLLNTGIIAAGKGYLEVKAPAAEETARLVIEIVGQEATAIATLNSVITNRAEMFNLQGQRVHNAQKGLYIVNGKKMIIR